MFVISLEVTMKHHVKASATNVSFVKRCSVMKLEYIIYRSSRKIQDSQIIWCKSIFSRQSEKYFFNAHPKYILELL